MANTVAWNASLDPTVRQYQIERSISQNGPYNLVATVTGALTGANYDPILQKFSYVDVIGASMAFYKVTPVDLSGNTSFPIGPFIATVMPFFVPGSTPFGVYDNDQQFVADADNMVDFVKRKLGEPVMTVHMSSSQVYAAFEEACLEYSSMVNSYQAKSVMSNYLGSPTGSLTGGENKYVTKNLQFELYQADAYSAEAGLNSMQGWYTASIILNPGQQTYDMQALLSGTGPLTGAFENARVDRKSVV